MEKKHPGLTQMENELLEHFYEYEKMAMTINRELLEAIEKLLTYAPADIREDCEWLVNDVHLSTFSDWNAERQYYERFCLRRYYTAEDDEDISGDEDQQCLMELIRNYREPENTDDEQGAAIAAQKNVPNPSASVQDEDALPF